MQKYLKYGLPLFSFLIILFFANIFEDIITSFFAWTYRLWFDFFINSIGQELLRQVDINSVDGSLKFLTAFVNLNDLNNIPVRTTEIEIFNEIILPINLFISLSIYFIHKRNIKVFLIFLVVLIFSLWLKNIAIIYDNFNNPEYILKDLIFPIKQLVYYFNSLLTNVGTTFGIMLSLIFAIIFLVLNSKIKDKLFS